jgi:hypothetical protein
MLAAFSVIRSGQLTQFSNSKVAMMFLVATITVCDRCDGCVTTEIGNVTTCPKSVMNQTES